MLDRHLDLAMEGSSSLNLRGAALAALLATTFAVIANASVIVIDDVDRLPGGYLVALAVVFAIALLALAASVIFTISAIQPSGTSAGHLRKIVDELGRSCFDEQEVGRLTWDVIDEQERANDRKSAAMRTAYVLAGIGIGAMVVATALYCAAIRVS